MFRAVTFVALVAYASAQSLGISSQCQSTLTSLVVNPDAACLDISSLIPVVTAGSSLSSLIGPINTWLTNLCNTPACSNATIAAIVQNVTTGCTSDLSSLGFTSSDTSQVTNLVEQFYPTVRQVVCLKDGSTNCITQTLTNIQNVTDSFNLTSIASLTTGAGITLPNVPTNVTCTNCIKAIYNQVKSAFPSAASDAAPALQSQCGASFTDGTAPSGIVESATTATTVASNSAALGDVSLLSHGVVTALGLSGLVGISTFFTLLA